MSSVKSTSPKARPSVPQSYSKHCSTDRSNNRDTSNNVTTAQGGIGSLSKRSRSGCTTCSPILSFSSMQRSSGSSAGSPARSRPLLRTRLKNPRPFASPSQKPPMAGILKDDRSLIMERSLNRIVISNLDDSHSLNSALRNRIDELECSLANVELQTQLAEFEKREKTVGMLQEMSTFLEEAMVLDDTAHSKSTTALERVGSAFDHERQAMIEVANVSELLGVKERKREIHLLRDKLEKAAQVEARYASLMQYLVLFVAKDRVSSVDIAELRRRTAEEIEPGDTITPTTPASKKSQYSAHLHSSSPRATLSTVAIAHKRKQTTPIQSQNISVLPRTTKLRVRTKTADGVENRVASKIVTKGGVRKGRNGLI